MLTEYDFCFNKEIEELSVRAGLIPIFFSLLKEKDTVKVFLIYGDKHFSLLQNIILLW